MAKYRLSKRAYADIVGIGAYTIERFGIDQAQRYRDQLERAFQVLADNTTRGRNADDVGPGLKRWNYQSHVVFFRVERQGIVIVRVLHQAMDPARHPMQDD
jgi:toxin ParE1/3/4